MKNIKWFSLALVSLSLLTFQDSYAGNKAGQVSITAGLGYDFFAANRELQNTTMIPELALAYNFTRDWGIEASYGELDTHRVGHANDKPVRGHLSTVDAVYRFMQGDRFEPYVSFGLGMMYLNPNLKEPSNQMNINAGLGVQTFFSDSIAIRTEARDLYTISGGKTDILVNFGVSFLIDAGGSNKASA